MAGVNAFVRSPRRTRGTGHRASRRRAFQGRWQTYQRQSEAEITAENPIVGHFPTTLTRVVEDREFPFPITSKPRLARRRLPSGSSPAARFVFRGALGDRYADAGHAVWEHVCTKLDRMFSQ